MIETYTKDTLLPLNARFNNQHGLNEQDVKMANIYKMAIEMSRSRLGKPQCGDIVMMDDYNAAHIEEIEDDHARVCQFPYVPFISCKFHDSIARISTNTSGGPWQSIEINKLTCLKEQKEKRFCFFGHCGMTANGSVEFRGLVNVFKIK